MPVQVTYPGVYIQEEPSGVRTITGVSTSVALFVGMAARGPMNAAVNLLSFADFERAYGSDTVVSEITDQARQFFLNGGSQAYVIRIAANARASAADLQNEDGAAVLRLTAAEAGRIGDTIRVEVNYATAQPEATFNLVVSRETIDPTGVPVQVETETIGELSMDPAAARFVETTVAQESRLVRAAVQAAAPAAFAGYSMSGRADAGGGGAGTLALDALNAELLTLGNVGRLQVSVDQGPFAPVTLNGPLGRPDRPPERDQRRVHRSGRRHRNVVSQAIPGGAEEAAAHPQQRRGRKGADPAGHEHRRRRTDAAGNGQWRARSRWPRGPAPRPDRPVRQPRRRSTAPTQPGSTASPASCGRTRRTSPTSS